MARINPKHLTKRSSRLSKKESQQKDLLQSSILAVTAAAAVVGIAAALNPPRISVHTSILTGEKWLKELFTCPIRMFRQLGMYKDIFLKLSGELMQHHGLSNSKYVSAFEKLAIFLHFARTGSSSRMLQERFQRSGETISK